MADLRCALAVLPAEGGDPDRLLASLDAAISAGLGDLLDVAVLPASTASAHNALAEAAQRAADDGFDWLLAVSAAESLVADIFVKTAPALRLSDAVWGAAGVVREDGSLVAVERITRLAAQDRPTFFHAALAWWIGPSHFVRPPVALDALHAAATSGWYAHYMMALWRGGRAHKTAQALTRFHGAPPPLADGDREHLIASLERDPLFAPVRHGDRTFLLPYTGLNPVIERDQIRGQFFEAEELWFLADRLPRGLRIVDAGANTGNHTVFFAGVMEAERVIPVEPQPRAAAAIRDAVEANGLRNVDLSCLGVALGAGSERLTPVLSAGGGLGATRYVSDPQGTIPVASLDTLVGGPADLLKIDVEGMELAVLAGAAALIARSRPRIFIEVLDTAIADFLAWSDANAYKVEKLFPDETHCNYFLVPAEGS